MKNKRTYEAVLIGVSSGGMTALKTFLPLFPSDFRLPIIIVQHISPSSENSWIDILGKICSLPIKEADEKENIETGKVYVAPSNYHLLIEKDRTFSLTIDEKVNYARPSIDVLFETASDAFRENLIGIILTGFGIDGASGLRKIKQNGGMAVVQDPETAESPALPLASIKAVEPDHILSLEKIKDLLMNMN